MSNGTSTRLTIGNNSRNIQRQINLVDTFSFTLGTHQLKFGVDYRQLYPIIEPIEYLQQLTFTSVAGTSGTSPPGSVLSGTVSSVFISGSLGSAFPRFTELSMFGQDTWQLAPRLTLTYGLRWELNPPPKGKDGNDAFTVIGLDNPATMTLAPQGTPLWKTTYNNFAPRIGIAYQLSKRQGQEITLRGGFGLFYDLGNGQAAQGFGGTFPFTATRQLTNVPYPLSAAQASPPVIFNPPTPPYGVVNALDPNLKLPRTYQWSLSLERSLGTDQTLSVAYVASAGRELLRKESLRNPNPNFTTVNVIRNAAESSYNSLQLQFQRRLSGGLQALASYTWSHSIDTASEESLAGLPVARMNPNVDRGPSDFDVRHSFAGAVTYNLPDPNVTRIGNA
ncbi:MAG: TonB-dependent receptor domain-containing protein, partial [Pyrinomonadaceae bacterium]